MVSNGAVTTCASVLPLLPGDDVLAYDSIYPNARNTTTVAPSHAGGNVSGNNSQSIGNHYRNRKHVISCVTVPDSDSEGHYSPVRALPNFTASVMGKVIKPEPQKDSNCSSAPTVTTQRY